MEREIYVKCPYCGKAAKIQVKNDFAEKHVIDYNDCFRLFVVKIEVTLLTAVRKVEGEAERCV